MPSPSNCIWFQLQLELELELEQSYWFFIGCISCFIVMLNSKEFKALKSKDVIQGPGSLTPLL